MDDKFLKPYDPTATESRIYALWEKSGFFNPDNLPERNQKGEPFSIVLPPPNVTGVLHMGSALMLAIEDIMVRYARMKGRKTLWIPGTDHAAIATQAKVEKEISKKEGKSRHDLGREELLRRIETFAAESHDTIVKQIRTMGCSIDWSREAFTLDDKRNLAVRTAFKKMYDDDLIYRGFRVVNWDPKGQTTISDDEIVYETRKTKLYTFKYSKDIPISISTTRPETKLGDTAIAVHPNDTRYKKYIGQEFKAIFAGEPINLKVIADASVEPEFGTGALGVTPAHSMIDWEMSQRQKPPLPLKQVINEYARMIVGDATIKDKKTSEAREAVIEWLKKEGLLEREEEIEHNVALAERTGGMIEPLPKLQWFVAVDAFRGRMKEVVTSAEIKIIPDRFEKVYINWIDNLRDWCISRQIWYGHRIPVWYKGEEIYCGIDAPKGEGWVQDEDTLDTWFSSGLWTFSTLGWPDEKEFKAHRQYHPTTILETGADILFFWVARMILMSTYLLNEVPFKTVYIHGLVRDSKGNKISKSLGDNVDPVHLIEKFGADAVRMALIVGVGPGNDSKIGEEKIKAYKLFANKLWNVARFVLSSKEGIGYRVKGEEEVPDSTLPLTPHPSPSLNATDAAYLKGLQELIAEVTKEMDEYKFYLVGEKIYHYVWYEFADKILEESKPILAENDEKAKESRIRFLNEALTIILKLLHPFMPYVTEEIWQATAKKGSLLMVENWPA